jgi:hypothetical protein
VIVAEASSKLLTASVSEPDLRIQVTNTNPARPCRI